MSRTIIAAVVGATMLGTTACQEAPNRGSIAQEPDDTLETSPKRDAVYEAYVDLIHRSADSVVLVRNQYAWRNTTVGYGSETPYRVYAEESSVALQAMARLTDDFEAVVPPPDLANVHIQALSALRDQYAVMRNVDAAFNLCFSRCLYDSAISIDARNTFPRLARELAASEARYVQVRERIQKMLAPHGSQLAALDYQSALRETH